MPFYNNLIPAQQAKVDAYYNQSSDLLLDTLVAVNRKRFASTTLPADSALLDAKYAALNNQLGLLERQMTDVYSANSQQQIIPPGQGQINAITSLASQLDQLNQNEAVAQAYLGLADSAIGAAAALANG
jgi:hypothetical protein